MHDTSPESSMPRRRWLQDFCTKPLETAVLVLSVLLFAPSPHGQDNPRGVAEPSASLRKAVSESAAKYKIPGIAAALIEQGQLRAIEVSGVRDTKSKAPVTTNTIFEAGSLGEPVYAYAVLRLAAEGRINPGAPLTTYLPLPYVRLLDPTSSSPATEPLYDPALAQITAIRVMNHTSGMPEWSRNQHLRLQLPPGRKWAYSNEGYAYLQRVVEQVTGEPFDSFVMRNGLGPAGMVRSSFTWREPFSGEIATGYDRAGAPVDSHRYSRPVATATLYTSIREYAQLIQHLLASAPAQHAHESAVTLMLNPTITLGEGSALSWGLGVGLEKSGEDLFFFQRGSNSGFQSFVIASRKTRNGLVVLTNSGNGFEAMPEIVAAILGGDHPVLGSSFLRSP